MYNETNVPGPEYRVRPVTRFVVTKYFHPFQSEDGKIAFTGSSEVIGLFDNEKQADTVATALAASESEIGATVQP
jgi:hypothetical protein